MVVSRARRFLVVIIASLSLGAFGASSCDKGTAPQKTDAQTDKERLIESRKEQQEKRGELRDAVKSGASEEEIEKRKNQVTEGQKAIVQDKKEIREQKLREHRRIKAKPSPVANLPKTPNEEVSMITVSSKRIRGLMLFGSLLLGLIFAFWSKPSFSQTILSQEQAGSVLAIEKVAAQPDGTVTGEIRNNSKNTVRDVQLFIRNTFLWKDEFHPGKESPSAAFYRRSPGRYFRVDHYHLNSPLVRHCPGVRMADSKGRLFPSRDSPRLSHRANKTGSDEGRGTRGKKFPLDTRPSTFACLDIRHVVGACD